MDDVSFSLREKESLGIVGETGCGKSMTALSILGLVPCPPGKISGHVLFEGEDLTQKNERELGGIRGRKIAIIFQRAAHGVESGVYRWRAGGGMLSRALGTFQASRPGVRRKIF